MPSLIIVESINHGLTPWRSPPPLAFSSAQARRWPAGPAYASLPDQLRDLEIVSAKRGDAARPGLANNFIVNQPVTVYLAVHTHGDFTPDAAWQPTELTLAWDGGTDRVFKRDFERGGVSIPAHPGQAGERHGAPHLCFVVPAADATEARPFDVATGLPADTRWQGFRFTPDEAGPDTLGVPIGTVSGDRLQPTLPPRSWEFREQL